MKNFIQFLVDPIKMLALGLFCFLLAFIDSVANDASSFSELSILGKVFAIIVTAIISILLIRYMILPIIKWLGSLVE